MSRRSIAEIAAEHGIAPSTLHERAVALSLGVMIRTGGRGRPRRMLTRREERQVLAPRQVGRPRMGS